MDYENVSTGRKRTESRLAGIFAASAVVILLGSLAFIATGLRGINQRLDHIEHELESSLLANHTGSHLTEPGSLDDSFTDHNKWERSDEPVASSTDPFTVFISPKDLIPHPYYQDTFTLPLVYPNSTTVASTEKEKRYIWWVVGAIWKTAETGWALYNLIESCKDWSSGEAGATTKANCVYGAISTSMTVAGAGWASWQYGSGIWKLLRSGFSYTKRDGGEVNSTAIFQGLLEYQVATVNHTGLALAPVFYANGTVMVDYRTDHSPIFFGYDFEGRAMHMSYTFLGGINASTLFNMQHVPRRSNITKRDKQFNEQDFTSGGIEAGFSYNQEYDGGYLSTSSDYGQMDHEVSCNFNGLGYNGLEFQIYDNNHDSTIASGNIRAC